MISRRFFYLIFALVFGSSYNLASGEEKYADPPMPKFRVVAGEFQARESDIRGILTSNGRELWKYFPGYQIEPFVVRRGEGSPIVVHARNPKGEIVMRLSTEKMFWSQYAYQFGHEFCHILCRFDRDNSPSEWFEESLCETASLFTIRGMARAWEHDAPYPNWIDYRHSLQKYSDDLIEKYQKIPGANLAEIYRKHEKELSRSKTNREINGAIAIKLLPWFEEKPGRWESIRWINSSPAKANETFSDYLGKWHGAVPERHRAFVEKIASEFGTPIAKTAPD